MIQDVYKMPIDDVVIVDLDDNTLESPYLHLDLNGFPAQSVCVFYSVCMCVHKHTSCMPEMNP